MKLYTAKFAGAVNFFKNFNIGFKFNESLTLFNRKR